MYIITSKTRRTKNYRMSALAAGEFYGRCADTLERDFAKLEERGKLTPEGAKAAKKQLEEQRVIDENVRKGLIPSGKMSQAEYDARNNIECESDGSIRTEAAGKLPSHSWDVVGDAPSEETEIQSGQTIQEQWEGK